MGQPLDQAIHQLSGRKWLRSQQPVDRIVRPARKPTRYSFSILPVIQQDQSAYIDRYQGKVQRRYDVSYANFFELFPYLLVQPSGGRMKAGRHGVFTSQVDVFRKTSLLWDVPFLFLMCFFIQLRKYCQLMVI
jgi:hypothetical protein